MNCYPFIFILFGTQLFTVCLAITCYQCRTDRDKGCEGSNPSPSFLKECPMRPGFPGPPFCRRILQKLKFTASEREVVIRECGYKKDLKSCYKAKFVDDSKQIFCDCDTDACNTGINLTSSTPFWLLITVLSVTFKLTAVNINWENTFCC